MLFDWSFDWSILKAKHLFSLLIGKPEALSLSPSQPIRQNGVTIARADKWNKYYPPSTPWSTTPWPHSTLISDCVTNQMVTGFQIDNGMSVDLLQDRASLRPRTLTHDLPYLIACQRRWETSLTWACNAKWCDAQKTGAWCKGDKSPYACWWWRKSNIIINNWNPMLSGLV